MVLPHPEGPMMASTSPGRALPLTPCRMVAAFPLPSTARHHPNVLPRCEHATVATDDAIHHGAVKVVYAIKPRRKATHLACPLVVPPKALSCGLGRPWGRSPCGLPWVSGVVPPTASPRAPCIRCATSSFACVTTQKSTQQKSQLQNFFFKNPM